MSGNNYLDSSPPGTPQPEAGPPVDPFFIGSETANGLENGAAVTGDANPAENDGNTEATGAVPPPVLQDYRVFADALSRNGGLTLANRQILRDVAQFVSNLYFQFPTLNNSILWLAAEILGIRQEMAVLHPPEAPFTMSPSFMAKIDLHCAKSLLDANVSGYKTRPQAKVLIKLKDNPQWGLTQAVFEAALSKKAVVGRISTKLTHARNDGKDVIALSFGTFDPVLGKFTGITMGIFDLTERFITAVGGRSFEHQITLPLVSRIALMRNVYANGLNESKTGKVGATYWDDVDAALKKIRDTKKGDITKISHVFAKILEIDRKTYGDVAVSDSNIDALPLTGEDF